MRRSVPVLAATVALAVGSTLLGGRDPALASPEPAIGPVFPASNPWNTDVSRLPVRADSDTLVASIGAEKRLHPDFGADPASGIPYVVVPRGQAAVPVHFGDCADESDPGPYPVPLDAPIEGGKDADGDRHVIAIDPLRHELYEMFHARPASDGWSADSGAVFDLASNAVRPEGWTSADAAGLPIFPGLVRYDEAVTAGAIRHALRFTAPRTRRAYIAPARHFASTSNDPALPPMGLRLRLKASFDVSPFPEVARVILTALQRYGMLLADNGSSWFVSGAPDPRWNDDDLAALRKVHGSDFEAVDTGEVVAPTRR